MYVTPSGIVTSVNAEQYANECSSIFASDCGKSTFASETSFINASLPISVRFAGNFTFLSAKQEWKAASGTT